MHKIRKGDRVVVLVGKDKGKQGVVTKVMPSLSKVVVSGVQMVKKHVKPNPMKGSEGGFFPKEMPIHISNIAILNVGTGKVEKVAIRTNVDGKKERVLKRSSQVLV
jgi:large subunit ribosomal protein L24